MFLQYREPLIWAWWGSDHDAGTYVPCSDRVNPHVSQERKKRPVNHCQQFHKLLGLMSAASNVIPFGLLNMRPLQWWLKTKGFSPRGKPTSYDQGHAAMPTCLRHVEETLRFCLKARCWELLSPCNTSDGCISHRLGSGHE